MKRLRDAIITKSKTVDAQSKIILDIINNCEQLHTLPLPGGLFAQDALFMYIYESVQTARSQRAELDRQKSSTPVGM